MPKKTLIQIIIMVAVAIVPHHIYGPTEKGLHFSSMHNATQDWKIYGCEKR